MKGKKRNPAVTLAIGIVLLVLSVGAISWEMTLPMGLRAALYALPTFAVLVVSVITIIGAASDIHSRRLQ